MSQSDHSASEHYEKLAEGFDANWAYSPPYLAWMTRCITSRAQLKTGDRVADIGCGTGLYSRGLAAAAGAVICADPSAAMLAQLPPSPAFLPVQASAQDIAAGRVQLPYPELDAIIVKEAIHHIPAPERQRTLDGLASLLARGGRIVLIMLPRQISTPLFSAALELFERRQPDPDAITGMLTAAGLATRLDYDSYPLTFPKQRYLDMVRARYMSLLSEFEDQQIQDGIAEIDASLPADRLDFDDTFAFITGERL